MPAPFTTPVSISVPFEPNRNPQYGGNAGPSGLVSTEAQSAIEEAKATAVGKASRYVTTFSTNNTAGTGKWLDFGQGGMPSNNNPFVVSEAATLRSLSLSTGSTSTLTITIFVNGISVATLTQTSAKTSFSSGLTVVLTPGDIISAQVTSGTGGGGTLFNVFIRVDVA